MVIQFWFADDNTIPELVIMKKDAFKKFFSSRRSDCAAGWSVYGCYRGVHSCGAVTSCVRAMVDRALCLSREFDSTRDHDTSAPPDIGG